LLSIQKIGGNTTTENLAWAFGKIYQARFLSGIIAGSLTKNNNIGYLAAVRNSQGNKKETNQISNQISPITILSVLFLRITVH
jgi:hypothetical protein